MSEMNQQPQMPNPSADAGRQARLAQAMSSNAKPDGSMDGLFESLMGHIANLGTFVGIKPDSALNTGIDAHIRPPESGLVGNPVNRMASSLNVRGGRLAEMLALFKPDFSKITAPNPEFGMPIMSGGHDVSYAALGGLSSQEFAGSSKAVNMDSGRSDFG